VFLLCKAFGLGLCAEQSGYMEPTIPTYSVCLVSTRASYDDLKIGDIIVYVRPSDNARVIHRVIAISKDGIITKGDANQHDDGFSVTEANLYARYIGHIPFAARLYNMIHSQYGICIVAGLMMLLFVLEGMDSRRHNQCS